MSGFVSLDKHVFIKCACISDAIKAFVHILITGKTYYFTIITLNWIIPSQKLVLGYKHCLQSG